MGRLQFVHGNLQLCKSAQEPHRRFTITESMDGLPGMLSRWLNVNFCLETFVLTLLHSILQWQFTPRPEDAPWKKKL